MSRLIPDLYGNFGYCYFGDCMELLPQIPSNTFDLAFTDYPFNVEYKEVKCRFKEAKRQKPERVIYEDKREDYVEWIFSIQDELERVAHRTVSFIGTTNISLWKDRFIDVGVWYKPNSHTRGSSICFVNHEFFLTNGTWGKKRLTNSVFNVYVNSGFLRKEKFLHPCPRPFWLYYKMIKDAKAITVIDPMLGSGTTAQACEALGIRWLGFEEKEEYASDIERRIQKGISQYPRYKLKQTEKTLNQRSLTHFLLNP